jgi:hypothetical protein
MMLDVGDCGFLPRESVSHQWSDLMGPLLTSLPLRVVMRGVDPTLPRDGTSSGAV